MPITPLLTTEQAAEICQVSPITVRWWRHEGRGPAYVKVPGTKRVLYREAALEAWLGTGDTSPAGAQS